MKRNASFTFGVTLPFKDGYMDELKSLEHPFGFPTIAGLDESKKSRVRPLSCSFPASFLSSCPIGSSGIGSNRRDRTA